MKKSIFKRIGLIALAVCVAIGSFFVSVTKKQYNSASALDDTTIVNNSFLSSNVIFTRLGNRYLTETEPVNDFSYYLYSNGHSMSSELGVQSLAFSFNIVMDFIGNDEPMGLNFFIRGVTEVHTGVYNGIASDITGGVYSFDYAKLNRTSFNLTTSYAFSDVTVHTEERDLFSTIYTAVISPNNNTLPNLFMSSVEICSGFNVPYDDIPQLDKIRNSTMVIYTDTNGWRYIYAIPSWIDTSYVDGYYYDYRIYYLRSSLDFTDNEIYEQGYRNGLADNQQNIYKNGYNAGYDVGFGQGRQDGMVEANDYSFIALITSVIDVPVQTFTSLFNFNILGVNLVDFFLGLLTFIIIVWIIKLLIGGK